MSNPNVRTCCNCNQVITKYTNVRKYVGNTPTCKKCLYPDNFKCRTCSVSVNGPHLMYAKECKTCIAKCKITCNTCEEIYDIYDEINHGANGLTVKRHVHICPFDEIECDDCNDKVLRKDMNEHEKNFKLTHVAYVNILNRLTKLENENKYLRNKLYNCKCANSDEDKDEYDQNYY
jgi:hypothetical protein